MDIKKAASLENIITAIERNNVKLKNFVINQINSINQVEISQSENNAIIQKEDGLYVADKTNEINALRTKIQELAFDLDKLLEEGIGDSEGVIELESIPGVVALEPYLSGIENKALDIQEPMMRLLPISLGEGVTITCTGNCIASQSDVNQSCISLDKISINEPYSNIVSKSDINRHYIILDTMFINKPYSSILVNSNSIIEEEINNAIY